MRWTARRMDPGRYIGHVAAAPLHSSRSLPSLTFGRRLRDVTQPKRRCPMDTSRRLLLVVLLGCLAPASPARAVTLAADQPTFTALYEVKAPSGTVTKRVAQFTAQGEVLA